MAVAAAHARVPHLLEAGTVLVAYLVFEFVPEAFTPDGLVMLLGDTFIAWHAVHKIRSVCLGLLLALALARIGRRTLAWNGFRTEFIGRHVILGTCVAVTCYMLAEGLAWLIDTGRRGGSGEFGNNASQGISEMIAFPLAGFIALIVGAAYEELMFRGLLLPSLTVGLGSPVAAVISGAVLFAALHLANSATNAALAFFRALVLGFLFIRTRSLFACVAAHITFNLLIIGPAWAASLLRNA